MSEGGGNKMDGNRNRNRTGHRGMEHFVIWAHILYVLRMYMHTVFFYFFFWLDGLVGTGERYDVI